VTLQVRPADLEADRPGLIKLLGRNLPRAMDDRIFDWLYRQNPRGPARVWVAVRADEVVGALAAFPRWLRVGPRIETGWVLGDFCVDAGYRTLGPALALQRACLQAVDAGDAVCTYDFPSQAMTAVYRRLGLRPFGSMVRLVRILRTDRILKRTLPAAPAAVVSAPFNLLLSLHRPMRPSPGMEAMLLDAECGEEFSDLARRAGPTHGVCVERDADYLRWRYQRNPLVRSEFLALRRHGQLLAYAVIALPDDHSATVLDLFGADEPGLLESMAGALVEHLRRRRVAAVGISLLASHPWVERLRRCGFLPRESHPVVVHPVLGWPGGREKQWFLTYGDRDS
jgi:hypothetical protein